MASGTIERKCTKGHKKAEGRCSPRCVRWYPRIRRAEVVPRLVDLEVAVPHLSPAFW